MQPCDIVPEGSTNMYAMLNEFGIANEENNLLNSSNMAAMEQYEPQKKEECVNF